MKPIFILIYFLFIFGISVKAQVKEAFTEKELPSIELKTLTGESVNIRDYVGKGKVTVVNFWATWCGPCKQELNSIAEIYDYWQEDYDMELVAVSIDDSRNTGKVKSMVNGSGWEYIILLDANRDLQRALNFQMPPYTVLTDQKGKIVSVHSGYKPGDEFILEDKIKALMK
ncbi:MAG: TlpA disulfide reductase family protein [Chitinophagales bacterium]